MQLQSISGSEPQKKEIRKTNKKVQESFGIKKDISKKIISKSNVSANISDNIPKYNNNIQMDRNQKNKRNSEAPRPDKRSLSLVEKIRRTDNGNLAAKNMTQLNTKKSAQKKIKSIPSTNNTLDTDTKVLSLIKETPPPRRINLIPATNPTIKIGKINPEIMFDKNVDKYITEENVTDSDTDTKKTLNATSNEVPLMDGGFNLKDQNLSLPKDNLLPTPIKLNIEDAVKRLEELDTSPDTHTNLNTNSEIEDKEGIYYNPGSYLQGYLKEAFKLAQLSKKNVLVQGSLLSIIVMYETKQVFLKPGSESSLAVSERSLFALSSIPITRENIKILMLSDSSDEICKEDGLLFDYDPFMWKLATRASQGRIPEGTDLNRHMYLGKMPNIPKPKLSANALKIASLWAEEPCTLSMTAQTLDIPQREVFIFLSAAWALDLLKFSNLYIEPEFRIGGMDKYIKKQALKKDGLFKKMLRKVRSSRQ